MSTEAGSLSGDGMFTKLVNESDKDDDPYRGQTTEFATSSTAYQRQTHYRRYQVATACLTAFCLILLMVLVVMSAHDKGRDADSSFSSSSSSQMQKACLDSTTVTSEPKTSGPKTSGPKSPKKQTESTPTPKPVQCTKNWLYFNGSCYYISPFHASWSESQHYCEQEGGHLAIIHTAEEQTFLWNLLPRGHWNAYWFGISDEMLEGDWYWVDGTKLVGGFWEVGEPNNHINEDCGYIVKTRVLTRVATKSWYDAPCSMNLPWICERKAS